MKTQRLSLSIDEMRRFTRLSPDEQNQFVDSVDNLMNMPPEEAAAIDTSRRDRSLLATVRRRIVRRSRSILRRRQKSTASPDKTAVANNITVAPKVTLRGITPFTFTVNQNIRDSIMELAKQYNRFTSSLDRVSPIFNTHPLYREIHRLGQIYLDLMNRYVCYLGQLINNRTTQRLPYTLSIDWSERDPYRHDTVAALTSRFTCI